MKKKNLYQLVKQSLKEVLQEQRRDRRLRPDDIRRDRRLSSLEIARIIRDAGLTSRQFGDVLRKANISPTDAKKILPTLSVQQINDLIKFPSDFILPMNFTTNCDVITDYGTATIYINDPGDIVGGGTVGGEIGNSGCQEIEINDSFICCSSNNPTDDGLVGGGNMSYLYEGSSTVWSQWSPGAVSCLDLPDTGGVSSFTYQQFIAWYVQQDFAYTDLGDQFGSAYAGAYLSSVCGIPGCTDPTAINYDSSANSDDGSCEYIEGCMDEGAFNFDQDAVLDNGSCQFEGCTDASADNTGIIATLTLLDDNGDFVYANASVSTNPIYVDEDGNLSAALQDDALCTYTILGCTDPTAINYNSAATEDDDPSLCVFEAEEVPGCADPEAINYNIDATADDGSCVFEGCTDTNASNTNALTVAPTISPYTTSAVAGYNADNYPDEATQNAALCTYPIEGCTDNTAVNYNPDATTGNVSDLCQYAGCMDETAANYNPDFVYDETTYQDEASQNASLCQYAGCTDPTDSAYDQNAVWNVNLYASEQAQNQALCDDDDDGVLNVNEVSGCTHPLAFNYNENATDDDDSCTFNFCSDDEYDNYVCIVEPSLCIDPTQGNLACGDGVNDTPCPDGVFNTALGSINTDLNLCTGENVFCPDALAENGPTGNISEQNITQIADYSTCIYKFCPDEDAYNYSDVRPEDGDGNSIPWIANQDIPDNSLCEYVGCADNTYNGYIPQFEGPLSTEFPSPLSTITVYYYNSGNSGCEIDTSIGFGSGNGIQPTGNLSPTNTDCCPGDDDASFGCTDGGNLGQQYWSLTQAQGANYPVPYSDRTNISNLVTSHTAIPSYPGISATNYDSNNVFDDGSCMYNIGCMDPESVTYDPNAEINDVRLCRYCKDIVAVQCNPSADPNGYAQDYIDNFGPLEEQINIDNLNKFKEPKPSSKSNFTHTITRACVTIGGQKPEVGDEFLTQGIQYTSAGSGVVGGGNQILQVNEDVDVELGPDTVWDPLDDDPTLTYCCCPDPYPNTYINAEAPGATCGNACGGYPAPPEGCPDDDGPSGLPDLTVYDSGKPGKVNLTAVFRVTQVENHSTTVVTDLSPWQCSKRPPVSVGSLGVGSPIDVKPYKGPKRKINEIEISKKLRKSLTEMFKKKK